MWSPQHFGLLGRRSGRSFDAATTAWVAAVVSAGGTVSDARKVLVDDLIAGLKTDSIWTKLDRLWLFAAENAASALTDLVVPASATAVNTPTFTTDRGYAGDGATSYINLAFNPNTGSPNFTQNSADIIVWSNTAGAVSFDLIGTSADGSGSIYPRYADNHRYYNVCGAQQQSPGTNSDGSGLLVATRTGANASALYRNGSSEYTGVEASASLVNAINWRACGGTLGSSTGQCSAAGLGGGLSATDQSNLYSRIRTYMTAVGVP